MAHEICERKTLVYYTTSYMQYCLYTSRISCISESGGQDLFSRVVELRDTTWLVSNSRK